MKHLNFRKVIVCILSMALAFAVLAGCSAQPQGAAAATPAQETAASAPQQSEVAQATSEAATEEPGEESVGSVFTDMAGREVELPAGVQKVYGTDPVASITMYTLAPEKLLGWNYQFSDYEKQYILPEYQNLPVYGMRDSFNPEAVIQDAPDLILQMGQTNEKAVEDADAMQEKLNIPVVVLSGNMEDIPTVLTTLGEIVDEPERAQTLADYAQKTIDRAQSMEIPEEDRVTVYYGNGVDSLETAPAGTVASEVIELAGGVIVADVAVESPSDRVQVSKEQVIAWDPAFMFVNGEPKEDVFGDNAAQAIMNDTDYATIQAVKDSNVYGIPKAPFSWLDRPKADNRLIGLLWAGSVMYPEYYTEVDVNAEIKGFYELFYHMELTDEQLIALMDT